MEIAWALQEHLIKPDCSHNLRSLQDEHHSIHPAIIQLSKANSKEHKVLMETLPRHEKWASSDIHMEIHDTSSKIHLQHRQSSNKEVEDWILLINIFLFSILEAEEKVQSRIIQHNTQG